MIELRPQPGPQTTFLSTEADVAFYGGAAGGGKSFALLLEPLRHCHIPDFGAVIFRRNLKQIKNEGGLWDESAKIYSLVGASPNASEFSWRFPSKASISFGHLEYEKDIYSWQGSQITMIGFDEITHFTKKQFFYMLSRNRSTCGVNPYIRGTTNPDKASWVRDFIDWWIFPKGHPQHGLPDPDKAGVVRWFIVKDEKVIWRDHKEDFRPEETPLSFTFIPAKLSDNKILMQKDPGYEAKLNAMSKVERQKLKDGNWEAVEKPGELFQRESFPVVRGIPGKIKQVVRYWDRAASENPDADWTVGLKLARLDSGQFIVLNVVRFQGTPAKVEARIKNIASQDKVETMIGIEQDPGQAGKFEADYYAKQLAGYVLKFPKPMVDKLTRARPVSSQAEVGNILVLEAEWNDDFFVELEAFDGSGKTKDDQVDALSGAFGVLTENQTGTFTEQMSEFDDKEELNW